MSITKIPFQQINHFSKLIADYLSEHTHLKTLYHRYPNISNFKAQIEEKKKNYSAKNRAVLVDTLKKQHQNLPLHAKTIANLKLLQNENTFTVVTGHQLNLFTGPLYFLYKIISTINLSKKLAVTYPEYNFVPIYWMATEDNDFEEINHFYFRDKKICWDSNQKGAVGRFNTKSLSKVLQVIQQEFGLGKWASHLTELFEQAYLQHQNLTQATRFIVYKLFETYGLLILNGDDRNLKSLFQPFLKEELQHQFAHSKVNQTIKTIKKIDKNYAIQVQPRKINLFYLKDGLRERILLEDNMYKVNNTSLTFSKEKMIEEVTRFPERFSPNVLTRPLYQEVILPNLCYIGGGGELAYWLQLKNYFDYINISFPILLLRNSVLLVSKKQDKKLKKLDLSYADLFLKKTNMINKKIRQISNIPIDLSKQRNHLKKQFEELYNLAKLTDVSFLGAVKAQESKQIKGLERLEKRLLKAQKRKLSDYIIRISDLYHNLFPNDSLQERVCNFSTVYLEYGEAFLSLLMKELNPLEKSFLIIEGFE